MSLTTKKIIKNDLEAEYKAFKEKDEILDFSKQTFENKHERYGYYFMINNLKYEILVDNEGQIHGFDGILLKDEKVFFYEAKYSTVKNFNTLFNEAEKTNTFPKATRISGLKDSRKILGLISKVGGAKKSYSDEIDLLNEYLGNIRDKKKMNIHLKRMLFALGSDTPFKKTKILEKKLLSVKESLVIKYD